MLQCHMPAELVRESDTEVVVQFTIKKSSSFYECEKNIRVALNEGGSLATGKCLEDFDADGSSHRVYQKGSGGEPLRISVNDMHFHAITTIILVLVFFKLVKVCVCARKANIKLFFRNHIICILKSMTLGIE